jgi:hypothetical protein
MLAFLLLNRGLLSYSADQFRLLSDIPEFCKQSTDIVVGSHRLPSVII